MPQISAERNLIDIASLANRPASRRNDVNRAQNRPRPRKSSGRGGMSSGEEEEDEILISARDFFTLERPLINIHDRVRSDRAGSFIFAN